MHQSRIVCLGGGTGLSCLLAGLRRAGARPVAIVSTFDDGGSSGALSRLHGLPALGDLRRCLSALAADRPAADRFETRLAPASGGVRHAFGNLVLAERALAGGLSRALAETAASLDAQGTVLPLSEQGAVLEALRADGRLVRGEARIGSGSGRVSRLFLTPAPPAAHPPALAAIAGADLVVLGPGSLATSVLPHLLIPEVREALAATRAVRVLIGNLRPQPGETEGLDLAGHLRLLVDHAGPLVDLVLADDGPQAMSADPAEIAALGARVVRRHLADPHEPGRHDPAALAGALCQLRDALAAA